MINIKNAFVLSALVVAATAPGAAAQELSFDALYKNTGLINMFPAAAPGVPKVRETAEKNAAGAAQELAYEDLLVAPLWKAVPGAAAAVDLKEGFSPARYQGNRNVCSVFATLGLAEYLLLRKEKVNVDLSEEFLYYNAKLKFTDSPGLQAYKKEQGLVGYVAVEALTGGVVAEKEWPFLAVLPQHVPVPPLTDPDMGVPPAGISGKTLQYSFAPQAVRRSEIKHFLAAERKPVVMNLMLYFGNIDNASGRVKDPSESQRARCFSAGDNCSGHVVLLTGYDPAAREYYFRNSWGANWGRAGFGTVSEKYVVENCESCHFLPQLGSLGWRAVALNAAYGWSAELE
ncbi:MAG: hypothetical protein A2X29_06380 [Elusimicrobia bacterium GWA2_64_40]|nr:MAG: hypothetical protein A2X29_06380 [Elusimicrobia bacterium GWA2_64_40]OGR64310.1 MAG: hypothetical protein A2X30_10875 [Elusimicrobia bacterium GWB2_63_16]